jgi:Chemotaxis signal transduction protein
MGNCNLEENVEFMEVIEFALNADNSVEKYAVEVLYVNEVYSVKKVAALPCTPPFIIGIMNFRGKIISVIDIRNFLGFSVKKIDRDRVRKVIVIKAEEMEVGVAVDSVLGCNKIPLTEIQKKLLTITNLKADYFKGITREMSIILNIKSIIEDEKIIVDEEVI